MENARAKTAVSSTQENAFMVLAEALADKSRTIALFVDGVPQQGAFFKSWRAAALANKTAPHNTKWAENPQPLTLASHQIPILGREVKYPSHAISDNVTKRSRSIWNNL
jgi:hypothetical protein